jgi:hypothetical protein
LQRDPAQSFQSAACFAEAVRAWLKRADDAASVAPPWHREERKRITRTSRVKPLGLSLAAAAIAALTVGAIGWTSHGGAVSYRIKPRKSPLAALAMIAPAANALRPDSLPIPELPDEMRIATVVPPLRTIRSRFVRLAATMHDVRRTGAVLRVSDAAPSHPPAKPQPPLAASATRGEETTTTDKPIEIARSAPWPTIRDPGF